MVEFQAQWQEVRKMCFGRDSHPQISVGRCLWSLFWGGNLSLNWCPGRQSIFLLPQVNFQWITERNCWGSSQFCCCLLELGTDEVGISLSGTESRSWRWQTLYKLVYLSLVVKLSGMLNVTYVSGEKSGGSSVSLKFSFLSWDLVAFFWGGEIYLIWSFVFPPEMFELCVY